MKSGLTVTKDSAQSIFDALKAIGKRDVLVGIPSDRAQRSEGQGINNAELGYLHSNGGTIQIPEHDVTVNRKINADGSLAQNGQFVRAGKSNFSTIHTVKAYSVTLPPRPFLELGIADKNKEIVAELKLSAIAALSGDAAGSEKYLNRAGLIAMNGAKGVIQAGDKLTPLAESTKRSRRSRGRIGEKPLYDTGGLLRAITYIVRDKNATS